MLKLETITTTGLGYAAHNRLHAEYVDARHGARTKAMMQEEHTEVVGHLLNALGGRHIAKGDALDDTLPQDLKGSVTLRFLGAELGVAEGTPATTRTQILRRGVFFHPVYGKFTIDDAVLSTMLTNFAEVRPKAPTEMVVDFDHASGDPGATAPGASRAAGWVKDIELDDAGLWAVIEWTAEAAELIKAKQYRFISPEFDLNYPNKETGKKVGPTMLTIALTNRPFLEGMQPVVLSDALRGNLPLVAVGADRIALDEPSLYERAEDISRAYREQFIPASVEDHWVRDVFDDHIIAEYDGKKFKVPYSKGTEGNIVFEVAAAMEVEQVYVPVTQAAPGGNLSTPTAPAPELAEGSKEHIAGKEDTVMDEELRKLLGLDAEGDIVAAVTALKEGVDASAEQATELGSVKTQVAVLGTRLAERDRDTIIKLALEARKITPAMVEAWGKEYALRDPSGFAAYLETATPIGPAPGEAGDALDVPDTALSATEQKVAGQLGLTEEQFNTGKAQATVLS